MADGGGTVGEVSGGEVGERLLSGGGSRRFVVERSGRVVHGALIGEFIGGEVGEARGCGRRRGGVVLVSEFSRCSFRARRRLALVHKARLEFASCTPWL